MKKTISILLMAALCAVCAFGCGRNTPPPVVDNDYEVNLNLPKDIEAEISILIPGGNKNEDTMIDNLVNGFNLTYPNVKIRKTYVSVNSYETTVRNQGMAGTLADIIWTNTPDFYFLVANDFALPLNKYIEESEKAGLFNFKEDFSTEYFDMGKVNDNYYAMPRSMDTVVTFINTDILAKAEVDMSLVKDGWTWETFMSVCEKVRAYFDANGQASSYVLDANLTTWLSVCYPMLRSCGADVSDKDGNFTIDSQATRDCIEMVRQMVEDRIIVDSTQSSPSSYEAGTSAFLFQSASVSLFAERKALKDKVDLVSFPLIGDSPKIGSGFAGYSINSTSQNRDVCWAFLNYMASYDGQQAMAEGGLNLPSIRTDLEDYQTANWGEGYRDLNLGAYLYGPEYKIATDFFQYFDITAKSDLELALKDLFNNATNKNKSIDDCMKTVVRDMNEAIQK